MKSKATVMARFIPDKTVPSSFRIEDVTPFTTVFGFPVLELQNFAHRAQKLFGLDVIGPVSMLVTSGTDDQLDMHYPYLNPNKVVNWYILTKDKSQYLSTLCMPVLVSSQIGEYDDDDAEVSASKRKRVVVA